MTTFGTPARARFPRSNATGSKPDTIPPGSFAVNWPDRVIWVGDSRGEAIRFAQKPENWTAEKYYYPDDLVFFGKDMYRALVEVTPGPFAPVQWERITNSERAEFSEPYATGVLSGGEVGPFVGNSLTVNAGTGIIIDNSDPTFTNPVLIEWSTFQFLATYPNELWSIIVIDDAAGLREIPASAYTVEDRRKYVELATLLWSANPVGIASIQNTTFRPLTFNFIN